jgi:hypothetical protein
MLGESLRWWLDYIACNSEHPNKICNKNIKKNIRGSMMSTRVTRHRSAHLRWEGLTIQRETLGRQRRPKLEIGKASPSRGKP